MLGQRIFSKSWTLCPFKDLFPAELSHLIKYLKIYCKVSCKHVVNFLREEIAITIQELLDNGEENKSTNPGKGLQLKH